MLAPALSTRERPTVDVLTPWILAVITDPAGEPIFGVTETNAGVRVTLVNDPDGVPDARYN
jgi:hypothetical protein